MTKPKEYPRGNTSWLEITYPIQRGGKLCLYAHPSLLKSNEGGLEHTLFFYRCSPKLRTGNRILHSAGYHFPSTRTTHVTSEMKQYVLTHVAQLAFTLDRCPRQSELRRAILSDMIPSEFGSWRGKLTGESRTTNMRDLLKQCKISWLPTAMKGTKIREEHAPYGGIIFSKTILPGIFNSIDMALADVMGRHHPRVKMLIQLPNNYVPPPKRKRGRPFREVAK